MSLILFWTTQPVVLYFTVSKSVQLLVKFIVYSIIIMICFVFFAWKLLEAPLVMGFVEKSKYN